jgi:hypothetical protein
MKIQLIQGVQHQMSQKIGTRVEEMIRNALVLPYLKSTELIGKKGSAWVTEGR